MSSRGMRSHHDRWTSQSCLDLVCGYERKVRKASVLVLLAGLGTACHRNAGGGERFNFALCPKVRGHAYVGHVFPSLDSMAESTPQVPAYP